MWLGFTKRPNFVNFELVQEAISLPLEYVLLNTMATSEQECLIHGTLKASTEEQVLNDMLNKLSVREKKIIVYGKNHADAKVDQKYNQLKQLGFVDVSIYKGGMFEWLLLQDIYGSKLFQTTTPTLDILKYK